MYRWYRDAHVCIVHLADTDSTAVLEDIRRDQWFTRGWTLQELLAPTRIKFFSRQWQPLTPDDNDKHNGQLIDVLSTTTGIPHHHLRSFLPGRDMIKEKMIWASGRDTTRVEDKAYCLLGLFDISMSILYGEGSRAFLRLQAKLAKVKHNLDIFEWDAGLSEYHPMFPSGPHCFISITKSDADDFDKFIHRTSWTRSDLPSLARQWTWEQCHTAAKASVPRGDVSFRITDERLHIALVMYRVLSPPSLPLVRMGRLCLSAITTARQNRGARAVASNDASIHRRLHVEVLGEFEDEENWSTLPDLAVGVLDYEWGDANGTPVISSEDATTSVDLRHLLDAPGKGVVNRHIVAARKNRAYTAVVLQAMQPGCYQWIGWLTVRRPKWGWRKPKTVQIT